MKTTIIKNSHFYIASTKYGIDTLTIQNAGILACLKIIANKEKYFEGNKVFFMETFNGRTFKTVSDLKIKRELKAMLKEFNTSKVLLTKNELIKCCEYFKIALPKMLSEQLTIKFPGTKQKGWHKDHNNYNKREKWERTPAKRKTPARNVVKKATTKRVTAKRK
jgi:hypothetical protein